MAILEKSFRAFAGRGDQLRSRQNSGKNRRKTMFFQAKSKIFQGKTRFFQEKTAISLGKHGKTMTPLFCSCTEPRLLGRRLQSLILPPDDRMGVLCPRESCKRSNEKPEPLGRSGRMVDGGVVGIGGFCRGFGGSKIPQDVSGYTLLKVWTGGNLEGFGNPSRGVPRDLRSFGDWMGSISSVRKSWGSQGKRSMMELPTAKLTGLHFWVSSMS